MIKKLKIIYVILFVLVILTCNKNTYINTNIITSSNFENTPSLRTIEYNDITLNSYNFITHINIDENDSYIYIPDVVYNNSTKVDILGISPQIKNNVFATTEGEINYNIKSIRLGDNIGFIDDYAFYNMKSLTELILTPTTFKVGQYFIGNCTSLKDIYFFNSTILYSYCFSEAYSLENMYFINCYIDSWFRSAFDDIDNYKNVNLYFTNTYNLGKTDYALSNKYDKYGKFHLEKEKFIEVNGDFLYFESKILKYIGFDEYVKLPSDISTIGNKTFSNNTIIKEVVFNENNLLVDDGDIDFSLFNNCVSLKTVKLVNINKISNYMFYNCYNLENLNIDEDIEVLGDYALYNCVSLKIDDKLPINIYKIGKYAFYNLTNTSFILNKNISFIDSYAFSNMPNLKNIFINDILNLKILDNVFYNSNNFKKIIFNNNSLYASNKKNFLDYTDYLTYKIYVKYLDCNSNDINLTSDFKSKLAYDIKNEGYLFYYNDIVLLPTINDINTTNENYTSLNIYTSFNYFSNMNSILDSSYTSLDKKVINNVLSYGFDNINFYIEQCVDISISSNYEKYALNKYEVTDGNNIKIDDDLTYKNYKKRIRMSITYDDTKVLSIPQNNYKFEYSWYILDKTSNTYVFIENSKSYYDLLLDDIADLNKTYKCVLTVKNNLDEYVTSIEKIADINLSKIDIIIDIYDQEIKNIASFRNTYGMNYIAKINDRILSNEEMIELFGDKYSIQLESISKNKGRIIFSSNLINNLDEYYNINIKNGEYIIKINVYKIVTIIVFSIFFLSIIVLNILFIIKKTGKIK